MWFPSEKRVDRLPSNIKGCDSRWREYDDSFRGVRSKIIEKGRLSRSCLSRDKNMLRCVFEKLERLRENGIEIDRHVREYIDEMKKRNPSFSEGF